MTKDEYTAYEKTVKDFFDSEGINCLSDNTIESYESETACDCCNTHLFGKRYDASGYNPKTNEALKYSVCFDCLYYAQYGQLDDMTMMDMED